MGFDTIIKNGSVVTATDTYLADVALANGKITAMGTDLPAQNATKVLDASAGRNRRSYPSRYAFRRYDKRRRL
jgi:predicted amidohydrolase